MTGLKPFRTSNDIFAGFDDVFNRFFNKSFGEEFKMKPSGYPKLDIYDDGSELTVEAGIPGLTKDNVTVEWEDNILTIKGSSVNDKSRNEKGYKYKELHRSTFGRTISVDERDYDIAAIKANVQDGLLTVKVPKKAAVKHEVKKIEVK